MNVLLGLSFSGMAFYAIENKTIKNPSILEGCVSKWKDDKIKPGF